LQPDLERNGVRGVFVQTSATKRCLSSAVSPGTSTNVPEDCSPASDAAAFSTASGVSIRYFAKILSMLALVQCAAFL
jgi:hypothetical protein